MASTQQEFSVLRGVTEEEMRQKDEKLRTLEKELKAARDEAFNAAQVTGQMRIGRRKN